MILPTAPFWASALLVHQLGKHGGQFEARAGAQFQAAVAPPLTPDGNEIGVPVKASLIPKNALDVDLRNALVEGSAAGIPAGQMLGSPPTAARGRAS